MVEAARLIIESGAHGITVHPRPDQRHIRPADVTELSRLIDDELAGRVDYRIARHEGHPGTPGAEVCLGCDRRVGGGEADLVDADAELGDDFGYPDRVAGRFLRNLGEYPPDAAQD